MVGKQKMIAQEQKKTVEIQKKIAEEQTIIAEQRRKYAEEQKEIAEEQTRTANYNLSLGFEEKAGLLLQNAGAGCPGMHPSPGQG